MCGQTCKNRVLFDIMCRKKRHVVCHDGSGCSSDRYFFGKHFRYFLIGNILQPPKSLYDFRFKSYGSNSGFNVFMTLTLDLCSIDCHTK